MAGRRRTVKILIIEDQDDIRMALEAGPDGRGLRAVLDLPLAGG
jgi:hypothetical protein